MKAEENNQAPENTVIKAAAAECDAKTAALRQLLDPIEIACATRARIAQMPFSTHERERQAARVCLRHHLCLQRAVLAHG